MSEQKLKPKKALTKTARILSIYHIFRFSREVSMQELRQSLRGWSDKTFSRDIALLKRAGIPLRFSGRRKAFVLVDEAGKEDYRTAYRTAPDFPDGKKERQYLEKIIRLTTMMDDLPDEDCDLWYRETFPEASKRTMQRDFATLNAIGYRIKYERDPWNMHDAGTDLPPNHYYCDRPYSVDALTTTDAGDHETEV